MCLKFYLMTAMIAITLDSIACLPVEYNGDGRSGLHPAIEKRATNQNNDNHKNNKNNNNDSSEWGLLAPFVEWEQNIAQHERRQITSAVMRIVGAIMDTVAG